MTKSKAPYHLRAHHGMCLAYFEGKGYSSDFARHMHQTLAMLEKNPQVVLIKNEDIICAACPHNAGSGCRAAEKAARYDREVLRRCGLMAGTVISFQDFTHAVKRRILETGQRKAICGDCEWNAVCSAQELRER